MNRLAGGLPGQYPLKRISNYNWGVTKTKSKHGRWRQGTIAPVQVPLEIFFPRASRKNSAHCISLLFIAHPFAFRRAKVVLPQSGLKVSVTPESTCLLAGESQHVDGVPIGPARFQSERGLSSDGGRRCCCASLWSPTGPGGNRASCA